MINNMNNNMDPRLYNSEFVQTKNKILRKHQQTMAHIRETYTADEIMEKGLHLKSKQAARDHYTPGINWNDLENCELGREMLNDFSNLRRLVRHDNTSAKLEHVTNTLGIEWEPPAFIDGRKEFGDYLNLLSLFDSVTVNRVRHMGDNQLPLLPINRIGFEIFHWLTDHTGLQPTGLRGLQARAFDLAWMRAAFEVQVSQESILERMNSLSLPASIDRDALLKSLLEQGIQALADLDNRIEEAIQADAEKIAYQVARRGLSNGPNTNGFQSVVQQLTASIAEMLRQSFGVASAFIQDSGLESFANTAFAKAMANGSLGRENGLSLHDAFDEIPSLLQNINITFNLFGQRFTAQTLHERLIGIMNGTAPLFDI